MGRKKRSFYAPRNHAWHISPRMNDVRRCVAEHQCPFMRMDDVYKDKDVAYECLSRMKDEYLEAKRTGKANKESKNPMVRALALTLDPDCMTDAEIEKESPYVQSAALDQGRAVPFFYNSPYRWHRDRSKAKMAKFALYPKGEDEKMTKGERGRYLKEYLQKQKDKNSNAYDLVRDRIAKDSKRSKLTKEVSAENSLKQVNRQFFFARPSEKEGFYQRGFSYYYGVRDDLQEGNNVWHKTEDMKNDLGSYDRAFTDFANKHKKVLKEHPELSIGFYQDPKSPKQSCFKLVEGFDTAEKAREASIKSGSYAFYDNSMKEMVPADTRRWEDTYLYKTNKARAEAIEKSGRFPEEMTLPNISHVQTGEYRKIKADNVPEDEVAFKPNRNKRKARAQQAGDLGTKELISRNPAYMSEEHRLDSIPNVKKLSKKEINEKLKGVDEVLERREEIKRKKEEARKKREERKKKREEAQKKEVSESKENK